MTEHHPFQALLDLAQFDQDIHHITAQIDEQKSEIEQLQTQLNEAQHALEESKKKVRDFKKLVDEQELIMKEVGVSQKDKKRRLDTASNYKEMTALQDELATLNRQEEDSEQQLLDLWNKLENAQKEVTHVQEVFDAKNKEIDAAIAKHQDEIKKLLNEIEAKKLERAPLEAKVPEEWREKYSAMRAKISNPIVPVVNNMCSACYYTVTSQEQTRLRHRALLQCQSCYRLIYSPEAMEQK